MKKQTKNPIINPFFAPKVGKEEEPDFEELGEDEEEDPQVPEGYGEEDEDEEEEVPVKKVKKKAGPRVVKNNAQRQQDLLAAWWHDLDQQLVALDNYRDTVRDSIRERMKDIEFELKKGE